MREGGRRGGGVGGGGGEGGEGRGGEGCRKQPVAGDRAAVKQCLGGGVRERAGRAEDDGGGGGGG